MGVKRLNYKDLTPEQRRQGAKNARERIRAALLNPVLSPEQSAYLQEQMRKIDAWESCTLDCVDDHQDPPPTE